MTNMFSRKQYDNKKHPYRGKGNRSPKPYRKEKVADVLKDVDGDIYKDTPKSEKR